jgi:hypothetical protein
MSTSPREELATEEIATAQEEIAMSTSPREEIATEERESVNY